MTPYEIATRDMEAGVKEIVGKDSHPRILQAFDVCTYDPGNDETAWCSAMMNLWQKEAGNEPTHSAASRSWLKWGQKIEDVREGAVLIFRRGSNPKSGHVALATGKVLGGMIECLGGNQGNAVKVSWFSQSDLIGIRWPACS